jgi:hypothetical protein
MDAQVDLNGGVDDWTALGLTQQRKENIILNPYCLFGGSGCCAMQRCEARLSREKELAS